MNFNEAPPPENRRKGYRPDPTGESTSRWWNGKEWTEHVSDKEAGQGKSSGRMPTWLIITLCVVGALVVVGVIIGEEEEKPPAKETAAKTTADKPKAEKPVENPEKPAETQEPPADPRQEIADALKDVDGPIEDPEIKDFNLLGKDLLIDTKTPSGGLEGASVEDMNYQVSAIFQAIYKETNHRGPTEIEFTGGLIDTKTGADLPDAITGRYVISKREAQQIDWDDDDAVQYGINWSLYQTFVHPAVKQ